MSRGKKLGLLLAVLVVLSGAAYATIRLASTDGETEEDTGTVVFTAEAEEVTSLSWSYAGETVTVVSDDTTWRYAEDSAFPLDVSYIESMLDTLDEVTATKTIENAEDISEYGLEDPVCTVEVAQTTGETVTLRIGDETGMGGARYLSTGDGNVYLVDTEILDSFSYGLYDVVEKEPIPAMTDVVSMTVSSADATFTAWHWPESGLAYSDDYEWFTDAAATYAAGTYRALDTDLTESYVDNVTGLTWGACVAYNADAAALETYGLDAATVTAEVCYRESREVETNQTDDDGNTIYETVEEEVQFQLEIGAEVGDNCYARIAGSTMVYCIDGAVRDTLLYTGYTELQPDDVLLMDWDTVAGMDIALDGSIYYIQHTVEEETDEDGNVTETDVYTLDGAELEETGFLDDLTAMVSTGFSNGAQPMGEAEIRFTFHRETETFSEVELAFYPYDSGTCLVGLDGDTRLFVAREDVDTLKEEIASLVP